MDLTSSLEAKFGARSGQVHQISGKTWEVLLPQDAKVGKKIPILGSYLKFRGQNLGYSLSLIFLEAKFGAPTRISEANFGAKPPADFLIWKYPLAFMKTPDNFFSYFIPDYLSLIRILLISNVSI